MSDSLSLSPILCFEQSGTSENLKFSITILFSRKDNENPVAFVQCFRSNHDTNSNKKTASKRRKVQCFKYRKKGHYAKDCHN